MTTARRKNIRLRGFDYTNNGLYYVTICCANRENIFGEVVKAPNCNHHEKRPCNTIAEGEYCTKLNQKGEVCKRVLEEIQSSQKQIWLREFIVMPNHIHFIAVISQNYEGAMSLATFVRFVKSSITRAIHELWPEDDIWQKRYFEHIIRDDTDYERIVEYIATNPTRWAIRKQDAHR